jgi:WD40 repeat protein
MIGRTMHLLILLTATMGNLSIKGLGAEPLPPRALARIGDHRFYHGPGITCIALSPDGRRAASAAREHNSDEIANNGASLYDRLIIVWDAVTGEPLHELHVPHGTVSRLAFSPKGKRLAVSYAISEDHSEPKSGVVLFDLVAGTLLRQLSEFQAEIAFLQFSADGKQLRVSEWNGPVTAWDAATGKRLRFWKLPRSKTLSKGTRKEGAVVGVMSPDGRVIAWEIACCSMGGCPSVWLDGLRIVDAETNSTLYQKKFSDPDEESHHNELNWSFAFTSDGKRLVADCDKLVVWETATGKELTSFKIPGMARFALSPDGRSVVIEEAGSGRKKTRLRLWDIETRKPLRELFSGIEGLEDGFGKTAPIFSVDGKTLLAATESTLRLFDATTGDEHTTIGHRAAVTPRFSADGPTLSTYCVGRGCSWDVSGNKPIILRDEARKARKLLCVATGAAHQLFTDASLNICIRERNTDILRVALS